jgi:hypothetical protein
MDFIEVRLPKTKVYLTADEIHHLLLKDIPLYKTALARGKGIIRHGQLKAREEAKWESEGHTH